MNVLRGSERMIKQKSKIQQLFCKHEYVEAKKENNSRFHCITGETIYIVCKKCGKVKGSYFREYEGMGYK